jgi:hypothetical protein
MLYFSLVLNAVLVATLVVVCRPRANLIVANIALREDRKIKRPKRSTSHLLTFRRFPILYAGFAQVPLSRAQRAQGSRIRAVLSLSSSGPPDLEEVGGWRFPAGRDEERFDWQALRIQDRGHHFGPTRPIVRHRRGTDPHL